MNDKKAEPLKLSEQVQSTFDATMELVRVAMRNGEPGSSETLERAYHEAKRLRERFRDHAHALGYERGSLPPVW